MTTLFTYIRSYFTEVFTWRTALPLLIWIALCTMASYGFEADFYRKDFFNLPLFTLHHVVLYFITFAFPYVVYLKLNKKTLSTLPREFWILLCYAILLFSFRSALQVNSYVRISLSQESNGYYWYKLIQGLQRTLVMCGGIIICWWLLHKKEQPLYGTITRHVNLKPYWLILAGMLPLILLAGTQSDFLSYYPRAEKVLRYLPGNYSKTNYTLLYELVYGMEFFSVELFFRGFLILAFAPYVGRYCILPVAIFYVSIHYQKPLGECISSLFGGALLGIITYETRSIWGGVIVHIGIAWMMEAVAFAFKG
jgi:hypothetical protein